MTKRILTVALAATFVGLAASAEAGDGWNGRRRVSHQRPNDLFYNSYVGPGAGGAAAGMYVSPGPVPAAMGHTYTTYQPLMPHEFMYGHTRSYWTPQPGGYTRTNVRYSTAGGGLQSKMFSLFDNSFIGWVRSADRLNHLDAIPRLY